ncbi:MAG: BamA/TamA family outer membrane protein [Candidatus Edwardsbacteria bacterium]|jgi:outer membrane protein assembly factor BamA|nr:BamA/TamA family outer membrane protein [Candidatus Edwardsbacteria bacterium]
MRQLLLYVLLTALPAVPPALAAGTAVEPAHAVAAPRGDGTAAARTAAARLRDAGYLDAVMRGTATADSGRRYRTDRPSFRGNAMVAGRFLEDRLALRPGGFFDQRLLVDDLRRLARAYAEEGFPHATVRLDGLRTAGDTVRYGYEITEGPLVTVAGIEFVGRSVTTDATARRLAALRIGRRFDAREIDRTIGLLVRSGLFSTVELAAVRKTAEPGREQVVFAVREPRYNSLFGGVGYTQGAGQSGWLAGAFDLELRNISGTARQLSLHWQRPRRFTSSLRASYREPWLAGSPVGATAALRHSIEDSSYVQTAVQVLCELPAGDRLTVGIGASAERTVPGPQLTVRRSLHYGSLWQVRGDHRDPRRGLTGWRWRLQLGYGRKRVYDPSLQFTLSRAELDLRWTRATAASQRLDLAGHARALSSSEHPVPRPDQYQLGGAASVRGYLEQQFAASQAGWINAEYRLAVASGLEVYPFGDCGYLRDRDRGLDRLAPGYGVGLRLDTRLGRLQVDYGLGRGDRPADGKLHLMMRGEF